MNADATINFCKKIWANSPEKLKHIENIKKFADILYPICKKYGVQAYYYQEAEYAFGKTKLNKQNILTFSIGSPNINLMFLSPYGLFDPDSFKHFKSPTNIWEQVTPQDNIIQWFLTQQNRKYENKEVVYEFENSKYLFPLQIIKTNVQQRNATIDAMLFAEKTKQNILFKGHPTIFGKNNLNDNEREFKYLQEKYNTKYCHYVDKNCSLDNLINSVEYVFAADSAVMLKALLAKKKVATYNVNQFSELIPVIKSATELDALEFVDENKIKKFLTWYKNYLCIDINDANIKDKIEKRVELFSKNTEVKEMLLC